MDHARTWDRIPRTLRIGGVASACLLLVGALVYWLAAVAATLASLSIALVAAVLIAALLKPVVDVAHRRLRIPRAIGALVAMVVLLAAFLAPAVLLWRLTSGQFSDLGARFVQGLERLRESVTRVLPISDDQVETAIDRARERVQQSGGDLLAGAFTLVEVLAAIVLALFVAFFLLKDGPSMRGWLLGQLPERARATADEASAAGWDAVTRYIRGTLIVGAIDAVGIGIALFLIGVPLALPLALLVFVGGFIPYIGSTISGSVAVLVALAASGPGDALLTLAAVIAVQQFEGNVLEPFILGRQVRLHPVVVVVVVFAGSLVAGIAGAIVAVPLTAVAYRVYRVLRDREPAGNPTAKAAPAAGA